MPIGCSDDDLPWQRTAEDILDTKYPYGEVTLMVITDETMYGVSIVSRRSYCGNEVAPR